MAAIAGVLSSPHGGVDLDLDEIWGQAMEEYEHITGTSLKSNKRTFDAVTDDITERLRRSKSGSGAKAQQIASKAGVCLQRFGSIIAQATSVVFGPSQQCWNAISFVISAAQGYQAVLDGFAALLERCVVFLERLNIDLDAKRRSGVPFDTRLRKSTYKVIAHFFTALGHSQKLATSKRQKLKTVFQIVLFNDDAGVKDSLARMETMVRDLTDTKVSVILQDVQGLARYIRESEEEINRHQEEIKAGIERIEVVVERTETAVTRMHQDLNRKISQDADEKNVAKISKVLRLGDHLVWQERHQEYSSRRVPDTGDWLLQPGLLVPSWANIDRHGVKVMTLAGPSSHGKSYLSSVVVDYLLERYPRGASGSDHTLVAYYYAQNSNDDTLAKCLGSLVLQFARHNGPYAQAVASVCSNLEGLSSAELLWQKLVIDLLHHLRGTYFLVLDGLKVANDDHSGQSALRSVVDLAHSSREDCSVRLFVSTEDNDPAALALDTPGVARISLGVDAQKLRPGITRSKSGLDQRKEAEPQALPNHEDVVRFARARMTAMCARKPYLSSTLSDTGLDAASALAKGVRGDYSSLQVTLDRIEASDSAEEVLDVIQQASKDPAELLRRDIQMLNESLSSDEIQELNDLLVWIIGSFQPTTMRFLEAAIGEKTLWLKKHIPQKFYSLLRWDEDTDVVEAAQSSEIVKILRGEEAGPQPDGIGRPNEKSPVSALSESEIQLVQRVVKTFCGDELFDKFSFGSFFESKLGKRNARIQLPDQVTMHCRLLRRCLQSFSQNTDDEYFLPLREYAAAHFVSHLRSVDLTLADREDLKAVGSMLANLVTEEASIRSWWQTEIDESWQMEELWVLKDENVKTLKDLLKHPLLSTGYVGDVGKASAAKRLLDDAAGPHSVLENVAVVLARKWYESINGDESHLWWSVGIMFKTWNLTWHDNTIAGVADLLRYDQWAKQLPNINVSEAHWAARIADTLLISEHYKEALDKCLEVDLDAPENWPALLIAAIACRRLEKNQDALGYLHRVKTGCQQLLIDSADFKKAYWDTLLLEEGYTHWDLEQFDQAQGCFLEIVKNKADPDAISSHEDAMVALFELWDEWKTYGPAIENVRGWMATADPSDDATHWFLLLHSSAEFHKCLVSAAVLGGGASEILQAYEHVMASIDPRKHRQEMRLLRFYFAAAKYHSSDSPDGRSIAFRYWEDVISTSGDEPASWAPGPAALKDMVRALLDSARTSGLTPMTPAASRHVEILESIAALDLPVIRSARKGNNDPRLGLIRLHTLAGQHEKAKTLATDCLSDVFDKWPAPSDEKALFYRYCKLGQVFNVLGGQETAAAAWGLLQPQRTKAADGNENANAGAEEPDHDEEVSETAAEEPNDDEEGSEMATEEPSPESNEITATSNDSKPAEESDASEETDSDPFAGLTSLVSHWCNGCETAFQAMADVYICKDCLNMHLCASCHDKLQRGELHVLCCSKDHTDHLYLPPFDREQWEAMDPTAIRVGDAVLSRTEWLEGLRERWGLQQERIDEQKLQLAAQVRAAKVLTRWRRTLVKVRAGRR